MITTLYFLGASNANYQTMTHEAISHDKDAMKPPHKVTGAIAKSAADAASWTWNLMKTPFA